jgi:hypothetical protein
MPNKLVRLGILGLLLLGCDERERLTFEPDEDDRIGPVSRILPPATDTTVTEGDVFVIGGRAVDGSGVDSVFIDLLGADLMYLPLDAEGVDTFRFGLNLPTLGLAGTTVTVSIFGVDLLGNVGLTVVRQITIE